MESVVYLNLFKVSSKSIPNPLDAAKRIIEIVKRLSLYIIEGFRNVIHPKRIEQKVAVASPAPLVIRTEAVVEQTIQPKKTAAGSYLGWLAALTVGAIGLGALYYLNQTGALQNINASSSRSSAEPEEKPNSVKDSYPLPEEIISEAQAIPAGDSELLGKADSADSPGKGTSADLIEAGTNAILESKGTKNTISSCFNPKGCDPAGIAGETPTSDWKWLALKSFYNLVASDEFRGMAALAVVAYQYLPKAPKRAPLSPIIPPPASRPPKFEEKGELKFDGRWLVYNVPDDGNCLLWAIISQTEESNVDNALRNKIVKHMHNNWEEVQHIVGEEKEVYLERIGKNSAYLGDIEIAQLTKILQRQVWIIREGGLLPKGVPKPLYRYGDEEYTSEGRVYLYFQEDKNPARRDVTGHYMAALPNFNLEI